MKTKLKHSFLDCLGRNYKPPIETKPVRAGTDYKRLAGLVQNGPFSLLKEIVKEVHCQL